MAEPSRPIQPVIMCGGSGTRLWPVSREVLPKQFCVLSADETLFQQTLLRLRSDGFLAPVIVCAAHQKFIAADQGAAVGVEPSAYLLEPVGRNTMAVAVTAALHAKESAPGALVLLLPSDAHIGNAAEFRSAVRRLAAAVSDEDAIGLLGVTPEGPETGYGYIRCGAKVDGGQEDVFRVASFLEKPNESAARAYVEAGDVVWNAGIFLYSPDVVLAEAERLKPDIVAGCAVAYHRAKISGNELALENSAFSALESISFDHAVMEHTDRAIVARAAINWSDVGSWTALGAIMPHDEAGNAIHGDVLALDTKGSVIWAEDRLVATLGVDDLAVVVVGDAVLVARRDCTQKVRDVVSALQRAERPQAVRRTTEERPWGSFTEVSVGQGFRIKRIVVKPGGRLSLQSHRHRSEHWVVVRGTPRVTCNETVCKLTENEHIFVPLGTKHRLENPTEDPVEIVEVQYGDDLSEDDIVRYEDVYGRA